MVDPLPLPLVLFVPVDLLSVLYDLLAEPVLLFVPLFPAVVLCCVLDLPVEPLYVRLAPPPELPPELFPPALLPAEFPPLALVLEPPDFELVEDCDWAWPFFLSLSSARMRTEEASKSATTASPMRQREAVLGVFKRFIYLSCAQKKDARAAWPTHILRGDVSVLACVVLVWAYAALQSELMKNTGVPEEHRPLHFGASGPFKAYLSLYYRLTGSCKCALELR